MERIRCPNPKCGRRILDIEEMPPGETVLDSPAIHLKMVKGMRYILEGVLLFTTDVDCSTPFLSLNTAYFIRKFRLQGRRRETTQEEAVEMDTR